MIPDVSSAFSAIEPFVPRMGSQITANSYNFVVVNELIYLGTAINTSNDVSLEIKSLNRQLSSRDLSRATILTLYKALILPVLLYGAEALREKCCPRFLV